MVGLWRGVGIRDGVLHIMRLTCVVVDRPARLSVTRFITTWRATEFVIAQPPHSEVTREGAARRGWTYRRDTSRASLSDVAPGATCSEVAGCCWPTLSCGKLALKFLYKSSLGFCDVLLRAMLAGASVGAVAARARHRGMRADQCGRGGFAVAASARKEAGRPPAGDAPVPEHGR